MSIMIPVLIIGGTPEERLEKAQKMSNVKCQMSNVDLILIDSQTPIGIDEIRGLQKRLSLKPFGKGPKIAIINNAQSLTIEAQNAFLKTLEEPPKNSQIILTAPTAESLLPTIVSRCQIIDLPYKPQFSLSQKELSQYLNILISFISSSIGERFQKIDQLGLAKDRQKAIEWVDNLILATRELLLFQFSPKPSPPSFPSQPFSHLAILTILRSLLQTKTYLQANVNTRLALDNFLLDLPDNSVLKSS